MTRSILLVTVAAAMLAGCAGRPAAGPGTLVDTTRGTVGPIDPRGSLVPHEQIMPLGPYLLTHRRSLRVVSCSARKA